jgi:hypothetical protein
LRVRAFFRLAGTNSCGVDELARRFMLLFGNQSYHPVT